MAASLSKRDEDDFFISSPVVVANMELVAGVAEFLQCHNETSVCTGLNSEGSDFPRLNARPARPFSERSVP
jgi:hypothetical protein